MPVDNSRLKGFFRLSVEERREIIAELAGLSPEHVAALANYGELDELSASRMIENVIGTMSLPVGVAINFLINGAQYIIPFCIEESSVVAAASNMAKRCLAKGGFSTNCDDSVMISQIQILDLIDLEAAEQAILAAKRELIGMCNSRPSTMIRLGGGARIFKLVSLIVNREKCLFYTY